MDKYIKNDLLKVFEKTKLMSLATHDKDLWSATVYFLYDKDLNIYFLSPTGSLHCKNIAKNSQVSLTIADSRQKSSAKKVGVQIRGECKKITSLAEIKNVVLMWNKRHLDTPPITFKKLMKVWTSRFYKITPTKIRFFNENYGEEKVSDVL